jgi:hypothetical protein
MEGLASRFLEIIPAGGGIAVYSRGIFIRYSYIFDTDVSDYYHILTVYDH